MQAWATLGTGTLGTGTLGTGTLGTGTLGTGTLGTGNVDSGNVDDIASNNLDVHIEVPKSHLSSSRKTLYPAEGANDAIFEIQNGGELDAEISEISFKPHHVIKVDENEVAASEADSANLLTIRFGTEHNKTTHEGRHGMYQRELDSLLPILPAGDRTRLLLTAVNPKHFGWGLVGDVTISYNSDDDLTVKSATVVFVLK